VWQLANTYTVDVVFVDWDNYYQFSEFTFIITAISLVVPLIICVMLLILQHLRFRRFKQQTGQIYCRSSFPLKLLESV